MRNGAWAVEYYHPNMGIWRPFWAGYQEEQALQEFAFATYKHDKVRLVYSV